MAQSPDVTDGAKVGPVRALRAVFSGVGQLLQAADRFREEEAERLQAEEAGDKAGEKAPEVKKQARAADQTGPLDDELSQPRLLKITGNADLPAVTAKPAKGAKTTPAKRTTRKPGPAPQQSRFRSLDATGNVRLLTDQDKADLAEDEHDRNQLIRPTIRLNEVTSLPSYTPPSYTPPSYTPPSYATPSYTPPSYATPSYEPAALPIADYDGLSVASLRARLRGLDPDQLRQLADYEAGHANRPEIVTMYENRIIKLESAD